MTTTIAILPGVKADIKPMKLTPEQIESISDLDEREPERKHGLYCPCISCWNKRMKAQRVLNQQQKGTELSRDSVLNNSEPWENSILND